MKIRMTPSGPGRRSRVTTMENDDEDDDDDDDDNDDDDDGPLVLGAAV